ncbi:M56 family metallopeptidase [Sphingosinithalassobacter portus]|uniref:M56 family metallopeptidase n=1 Tax=Stakelama portus TaxID=2676234 RepID=UPI000D6DF198|nr:M56 family metallopeptidase [Sphingosinithalassobacter portus]
MIGWALETLIASTLLMLLVLAIRAPVRRAFGPGVAYALWLLPAVRMLMPPLPGNWQLSALLQPFVKGAESSPGFTVGLLNADTAPVEAVQNATMAVHVADAQMLVVPPTVVSSGPSLLVLLGAFWLVGTLCFLGYHLIAHSLFCRRLLARAKANRAVAHGKVRVIETDATHGPLAFGIWRKYVAFPRDFSERYDDVEQDLALAHELGHHVRGDLIANWVALIVLAIHWFNPVAWRAFRAFRADQEMACDALVLSGRAQALRHAYGRAIVKSAHGGAVSAACHLHTINEIKGRLRMLSKNDRKSPTRIASGIAGVSAIALAALGLTASGTQAAETIKAQVERTVGVKLDMQDVPPAAPSAPEAPVAPTAPAAPAAPEAPVAPEAPEAPTITRTIEGTYMIRSDTGGSTRVAMRSQHQNGPFVVDVQSADPDKVEVRERSCGTTGPDSDKVTVHQTRGDRQIIIICTDRIEAITANAERQAAQARAQAATARVEAREYRRIAIVSAREGLDAARASIAALDNIPEEDRAEALRDIESARAELEAEAASAANDD